MDTGMRAGALLATGALTLALISATGTPAAADTPKPRTTTEVDVHLDAATRNAAGDQTLLNTYRKYSCFEVEDPSIRDEYRAGADTRVPLTRMLDDLWYIGDRYVGQYILKTADGGFVLIDSLNNSSEVTKYTIPALQALGMTAPSQLKGVILSHGHGDHDGGASQLRALFGPDLPIYMGSADAAGKTYAPTPIDSTDNKPQFITLGGTRIAAQSVPGHTPGSLVLFIPAHHNGHNVKLLVNGRGGIPTTAAGSRQYLQGTERAYWAAKQLGATGTIHTHPLSDVSMRNIDSVHANGTIDPYFLLGTQRTLRAAALWRECAAARAAQADPAATIPVWRVTTVELPQRMPLTKQLSARVDSPWGPVPGQRVEFSAQGSKAGCVAITDQHGEANCRSAITLRPRQKVTAKFAGNTSAEYVNLPSSGSAHVTVRD
ncbi:MBL fold metallo-hydrolase [Streptomyces sp. NPDC047725]|uniref:MBL fold metallo-hydrolase n=1 Tax=Streptomyces sp. NPDC047725 TaxID=3365487 RepID=UPI00371E1BDB